MNTNIFKKDYFYDAATELGMSVRDYLKYANENFVIIEDGEPCNWNINGSPAIFGGYGDALDELAQWTPPVRNVSIITEEEFLKTYCKEEYEKAMSRKFKGGEHISWMGGIYLITGLSDRGYYVEEIHAPKNAGRFETTEIGFINEADINEVKELPKYEEIMYSGSHNPELVERINHAWNKNREGFKLILCALYERDIDEITDADSFKIPRWFPELSDGEDCTPEVNAAYALGEKTGDWTMFNELALADMKREWDLFAENYLDNIADDTDLECILNFLHYPYLSCFKD